MSTRVDAVAYLRFEPSATQLFPSITGMLTGDFESWIPDLRGPTSTLATSDLMPKRKLQLATENGTIADCTIQHVDLENPKLFLRVGAYSKIPERSYGVKIYESGSGTELKFTLISDSEYGLFFGHKEADDRTHFRDAWRKLLAIHPSGKKRMVAYD